jgi:hypothetical protein
MFKLLLRSCFLILLVTAFCASQETTPPDAPQQTSSQNAPQENKPEVQKIVGALAQVKNLPAEWIIGPYIPSSGPLIPLTTSQRANVYLRQTFLTPGPYVVRLFSAGVDQARNSPSQWGGGMGAYGERVANRYGRFLIANTVSAVGNAAVGYEPRYDLCRCHTFWLRTRHAIMRNFLTYNNTETELRPAFPLYGGAFASGLVSSQWLPGKQGVLKDGAYAMLSQAGYGTAYNWVSEFAVDIVRKITKKNLSKQQYGP